jgi:homospermidine synthase
LIPHGEAYTISKFFRDKETGYSPSQYFVYKYNRYADEFVSNLPKDTTLENCNPEMEVMHPSKYKIQGYNKVGAMMIFKNNRGWWTGSLMDEYDASLLLDNKFGPTVIQVAGGVYSAFMWTLHNRNAGNKWPEDLDSDFILQHAKPFLGRLWSNYVDLSQTHLKDCYKLESFLTKKF